MVIFGGRALERSLGLEGGAVMNAITAIIRGLKALSSLCPKKMQEDSISANQEGCSHWAPAPPRL